MVHQAMKRGSFDFQIQNYFLPFKMYIFFNQGKQFHIQYQHKRHYTVNVAA